MQQLYKPFLATDQFGNTIWIKAYPRKELMAHFGRTHAHKMYRDVAGQALHVGYVVGPHWCEVVRVLPFKDHTGSEKPVKEGT